MPGKGEKIDACIGVGARVKRKRERDRQKRRGEGESREVSKIVSEGRRITHSSLAAPPRGTGGCP